MNIAVTIFYALAGAWIVVLTTFAIVKKIKMKKEQKKVKEQLENEREETKEVVNSVEEK